MPGDLDRFDSDLGAVSVRVVTPVSQVGYLSGSLAGDHQLVPAHRDSHAAHCSDLHQDLRFHVRGGEPTLDQVLVALACRRASGVTFTASIPDGSTCECGAPADRRCSHSAAIKRLPIRAADVRPSHTVAFRLRARRLWKVLHAESFGALVALDLESRDSRFQRVLFADRLLTVVRIEPCLRPCCELHARDLGGGRSFCQEHWQ